MSSRPATAANDSWKLTSYRLSGFTVSSHAAGASHSSHPSLGRDARIASSPQMPATPARTIDGDAPVSSTYVATSGRSMTVRTSRWMPSSANANDHIVQSSTTFSPDTAMMWSRPLARKASLVSSDTPSSSPRTMPWSTSATGECSPFNRCDREAKPQPVYQSLQTSAPAYDGEVGEVRLQKHVLPAPAQVPAVVERAGLRLRQRLHTHRGELQERTLGERPGGAIPQDLTLLEAEAQVGGLADRDPGDTRHPHG